VTLTEREEIVRPAEQTRARYPDEEGYVERDGVRVFYEVYGEGEPTILFLPTWTLLHSRVWKMQIPYFARRNRVVVFDPRGNGRSDRPTALHAYDESEFAQDAVDVMDETGTERAVIVSLSKGAQRALLLAADHPERVSGAVFVGPLFPASPLGGLRWRVMAHPRLRLLANRPPPIAKGWGKLNAHYFRTNYRDFVEWFVGKCTTQPHSTKGFEDGVGWALETDGGTLALSMLADLAAPATRRDQLALARRVRCPVVVICGTKDEVTPFADARALARATGGRLVPLRGGDHAIEGRRPVAVNLAIREFLEAL
jgi:pimeloyl-ACP methyl ester carboxylesterase